MPNLSPNTTAFANAMQRMKDEANEFLARSMHTPAQIEDVDLFYEDPEHPGPAPVMIRFRLVADDGHEAWGYLHPIGANPMTLVSAATTAFYLYRHPVGAYAVSGDARAHTPYPQDEPPADEPDTVENPNTGPPPGTRLQ